MPPCPPAPTSTPTLATPAAPGPDRALCLGCHYPLRGLPTNRCPECGRTFDPSDPWTMNVGRPMPGWLRWLAQPVGRTTHAASLVAVGAIWWGTGWLPGALLVAGAGALAIGLAYVWRMVRCVARHVAIRRYRQPRELFRPRGTFRFAPGLALGLTLWAIAFDVPLRTTVVLNHLLVGDRVYRMWAVDPMPTSPLGPRQVGLFRARRVHVSPGGVSIDIPLAGTLYYAPDGPGVVYTRYGSHLGGAWYRSNW